MHYTGDYGLGAPAGVPGVTAKGRGAAAPSGSSGGAAAPSLPFGGLDAAGGSAFPPACITGGSNTKPLENGLPVLGGPSTDTTLTDAGAPGQGVLMVDWLRVTFPASPDALELAKGIFGPTGSDDDWTPQDWGRWQYKQSLRRGDVAIYYDGNGGTVCVDISGKGCRQIEAEGILDLPCPEMGVEGGWKALLRSLRWHSCAFPRVDWAMDDRQQLLRLDAIGAAVEQKRCCTRFRKCRPMRELCPSSGEVIGDGFTFGSRESPMFVRIYNKQLEQLAKGEPDPGPVMRCEVETHDEKAAALVGAFLQYGPQAIAMDLWAMLDFKEPKADTNRSRWETCAWWHDFLCVVQKSRVCLAPLIRTIEGAAQAVVHQWAATISAIVACPGYGKRWLDGLVATGERRWKPRHIDMMSVHLQGVTQCLHVT